jgi:hypothetical protein
MTPIRRRTRFVTAALLAPICLLLITESAHVWLEWRRASGNAARDAENAIAQGDFQLLGVEGGAGLALPGVDSALYASAAAGGCGFRVIHAGDSFTWSWQRQLHDASLTYARMYNEHLVARAGRVRICHSAV